MNIIHHPSQNRFETAADGETAYLDYMLYGDSIALMHTAVPEKISGRGIGTALVKHAFAYAQEHHLAVKPYCSFVVAFLNKNEAYRSQLKSQE